MFRLFVRLLIVTGTILLFYFFPAYADIGVEMIRQESIGGYVEYPQITGSENLEVQGLINSAIYSSGRIKEHLSTLSAITNEGGWGINVSVEFTIHETSNGRGVFSVLLNAFGKMPGGRFGNVRTPLNFWLSDGTELNASDIFANVADAQVFLNFYIQENVEPELSSYLDNSTLTPVPIEEFYITDTGIMFIYDMYDFSMLSGSSGAVEVRYYEIKDLLDLSAGSALETIGVGRWMEISEETASLISTDAENGILRGIIVQVGSSLQDAVDAYKLLNDPDYFPGGRIFELEAAEFRNVKLLTDSLTEAYDQSIVLGLRSTRVDLYGIITGKTTVSDWRTVLGQPSDTKTIDAGTAESYSLLEGLSDSYQYGKHMLTLFADKENVLFAVQLEQRGTK